MKMMRKIYFSICLLMVINTGYAQTKIRQLKIGDIVPDFTLKTVNADKPYFKLSDYRGKVVILDFWNRWCSVCIAQFPHVMDLGQKFQKDLVIMPIGFQRGIYGDIKTFYKEREAKGLKLPVPSAISDDTADSTLHKFFPFAGFPHEIWIDKDGIFRGASGHTEVTEENINKLIQGGSFHIKSKVRQSGFNSEIPLLVDGNGGPDTAFRFRSLLTGYIDSIAGNQVIRNSKLTRLFFTNTSISYLFFQVQSNLYRQKFNKSPFISFGKNFKSIIFAESTDSAWKESLGILNYSDSLKDEYKYCYDLILPGTFSMREGFSTAIQDFERYFKVSSTIEERPVKCIALTVISDNQLAKLKTKGGALSFDYSGDYLQSNMQNCSIPLLINHLNSLDIPLVLDETSCQFNIDLKINFKENNFQAIKSALNKHGLDLVEVTRSLNTLVLKKKMDF